MPAEHCKNLLVNSTANAVSAASHLCDFEHTDFWIQEVHHLTMRLPQSWLLINLCYAKLPSRFLPCILTSEQPIYTRPLCSSGGSSCVLRQSLSSSLSSPPNIIDGSVSYETVNYLIFHFPWENISRLGYSGSCRYKSEEKPQHRAWWWGWAAVWGKGWVSWLGKPL